MNHVIIRTCKRDDYLAKLCYDSFIKSGIQAEYTFLADKKEYEYIKTVPVKIVYKDSISDNYGGVRGVKALIDSLKQFSFSDDDTIILSDSDIVVFENFLHLVKEYDHCGTGGEYNNLMHISGQMQIFNGKTLKKLITLSDSEIDVIVKEMIDKKLNIADDTFNSYVTDKLSCKKMLINNNGIWIHYKAYEYVGKKTNSVIELLMLKNK
jgi:hypothetical protein